MNHESLKDKQSSEEQQRQKDCYKRKRKLSIQKNAIEGKKKRK